MYRHNASTRTPCNKTRALPSGSLESGLKVWIPTKFTSNFSHQYNKQESTNCLQNSSCAQSQTLLWIPREKVQDPSRRMSQMAIEQMTLLWTNPRYQERWEMAQDCSHRQHGTCVCPHLMRFLPLPGKMTLSSTVSALPLGLVERVAKVYNMEL